MRKAKPQKRVILPDPVYGEVMVAKFVNHLMQRRARSISGNKRWITSPRS